MIDALLLNIMVDYKVNVYVNYMFKITEKERSAKIKLGGWGLDVEAPNFSNSPSPYARLPSQCALKSALCMSVCFVEFGSNIKFVFVQWILCFLLKTIIVHGFLTKYQQ